MQMVISSDEELDLSDLAAVVPTSSRPRRATAKVVQYVDSGSEEEDEFSKPESAEESDDY